MKYATRTERCKLCSLRDVPAPILIFASKGMLARASVVLQSIANSLMMVNKMEKSSPQHPQFILAVDLNDYPQKGQLPEYQGFLTDPIIQSRLILAQRESLETDGRFRQILPYIVLRQLDRGGVVRYFTYRRAKGAGEFRLLGNYSIGVGGHVDLADVVTTGIDTNGDSNSVVSLELTVERAVAREVDEELEIRPSSLYRSRAGAWPCHFSGTLILDDEGVNEFHVGLLYFMDIPMEREVVCKEDSMVADGFRTLEELEATTALEGWSKILVRSFIAHRAASQSRTY